MKPNEFRIGDPVVFRDGELSFSGVVSEIRSGDIRIKTKHQNDGPLVSTESFDGRPYVHFQVPKGFKVYKCVGHPENWECSNKKLSWHCNPEKGIYREATHGKTREEAIANMVFYLRKLK